MKLTKTLLGTAFAIPSVVVPLTTLSSCGQNWGVLTPFTIGSSEKGINDPYADFSESNYYDFDGRDMVDYLQSNYTVDQKNSTAYAYAQPLKFVDDEEKKQEDQNQWFPGSSGWYTSTDEEFVTSAVDKYKEGGESKSQNVTNAQNSALSYNTTLVSSIAATINSYITNALSYQASTISVKDMDGKNLQTAWGADSKTKFVLNHGSKSDSDPTQNDTFYEYNFALANANAGGATKAMLRTSSVNFYFADFPFPTYNFDSDKRTNLDSYFFEMIEGTSAPDELKYYTKYEENKDEKYKVYFYDCVPIKVSIDNITETYLDPSNKSNSFLVSDYYSSKDDIEKSVGDSWKNIKEFTSKDYEVKPHYKSFSFSTLNGKEITYPTEKMDTRLSRIDGNDFIVLLSYQVKIYDEDATKNVASLTGFQNIFPSYFIDIFADEELFKKCRDEDKAGYIFNQDVINKKTTLFRQLFERTAGQGLLPIEMLDETSKNILSFLGYMFCSNNETNEIDTSEILGTTDI